MRLRRVEAVRYGRLREQSLGDLGDGLTVVAGPNEAGKSTFTALVRHALYGFPTQRDKEPGYYVRGEGRLVRLLFEEDGARWVVERSEGVRGGETCVRTLAGPDRPALLDEVTRGVSPLAYRVVFGFGLDEMARIEELRGSEDDIIARLYAASAGLRVSPHEVRASIDREAAELFAPRGRKPAVNARIAEIRDARERIRILQGEADSFQADQRHLLELEGGLAEAREARDSARGRATELAVAVERAEERLALIEAQDAVLLDLRRQRRQSEDEAEAIVIEDALLRAAPELDALLEEAGAFGPALEALQELDGRLATATVRAQDAVERTGLTTEVVSALGAGVEQEAAIDAARDDLQRLRLIAEGRDEDAARAASSLSLARDAAAVLLDPLGMSVQGAEDALAERFAALDALESVRGGTVLPSRASVDVPAVIMMLSGLAAIGTGAYFRQWATVGIGAVLVVAALVLLVLARVGRAGATAADERPYLEVLGLAPGAGALDLARTRRTLEAARTAVAALGDAEAGMADAERDAALAHEALEARTVLWAKWLEEQGLPEGLTPAAAGQLLGLVRDALSARAAADEVRSDVERAVARLDDFAARLTRAVSPHIEVAEPMTREDVPVIVNRLKERLAGARSASDASARLAREIAALDSRIEAEAERREHAADDLRGVLDAFGLTDGGSHDDLRVLKAQADAAAQESDRSFEELTAEKNRLAGSLEDKAHERRGGELRLEEAGLVERLGEAVDRYLVLAIASRLLESAQGRYERERQPDVVKHAERVFRRITNDDYIGLSVPLGDGRIEVFDRRSEARTSDILSRGTAEQLYLALRLGLIAQLGDAGCGLPVLMDDVLVNFDPERKQGAAEAVAELASSRQVVFFTCHPETIRLFETAAPGHTRLDLGRCVS